MCSKVQAIKMNVSRSQADKHVNKTDGAAGGGGRGGDGARTPTLAPAPLQTQGSAPRERSVPRSSPLPPSSSRPAPPAPGAVLRLPVGALTGAFVCSVSREGQEPAGKE